MIQKLLRKYKKAKAEWAKGNIKATPQSVEPVEKGRGQNFVTPDLWKTQLCPSRKLLEQQTKVLCL